MLAETVRKCFQVFHGQIPSFILQPFAYVHQAGLFVYLDGLFFIFFIQKSSLQTSSVVLRLEKPAAGVGILRYAALQFQAT